MNRINFCACIGLFICKPALGLSLQNVGVGAGLGANYAHGLGVNLRYSIDHLELLAAVGVNQHYGMGLRYNLLSGKGFWQPRIALVYGTNGDLRPLYEDAILEREGFEKTYVGWSLIAGTRIAFGRKRSHGVAFDIAYRLSDGGYAEDRQYYLDNFENRAHGAGGLLGLGFLGGLFCGGYDVQLSVGWEMKF